MENDINILSKENIKIKKPKNYKVIMKNDDFTTMEFVVSILEDIFNKTFNEANEIMIEVHQKGYGVAGIYPYDIAVSKVNKVNRLASEESFPFKLFVEEE